MKVALVTGGSKGIGKACAIKLASDGYMVIVNYSHSDDAALKTKEEIINKGFLCEIYKADASNLDDVKKMIRDISKQYGTIEVLVNNAGIVKDDYLLMMNKDNLDRSFELNVKGYFYCAQQVALKMFKNKKGVIINMSSVSGSMALAGQSVYSATKGAINSMTKTLAKELAPYGIRVNAIAPGFIQTEMLDHIPEDKMEEYLKNIPLHRLGQSSDVANLVSFLASDNASYITGEVITLDGGLSL